MNRRIVGNITLGVVVITLSFLVVLQSVSARNLSTFDQLDLLVDIRHELVGSYVTEPDQDKMIEAAVRGMVDSLDDPYTVYLPPEDLKPFEQSIRGKFSGIGAEIDIHENRLRIITPLEDSPAWKSGVLPGDIVLEIEGEDTEGIDINDAVTKLTGEAGTDVTIKVRHLSGKVQEITITRAVIEVQTVRGIRTDADNHADYMIDKDRGIAYVRLTQFNENSADELKTAIGEIKGHDAKALILDLRFNPGGLLESAKQISDMFLGEGQRIVSVKGRTVAEEVHTATSNTLVPDMPVVVLINEASASASEIVSGALADHGRAHLVGSRTFGKGSVQQVKMLQRGPGAIKITNAYYYIPSGRKIHRIEDAETWGVDPTDGSYVSLDAEQLEAMLTTRREAGINKMFDDEAGNAIAITPDFLAETYKDPQLAAALTAAIGKVDDGEFPAVGEANEEQLIIASRKAALERQRDFFTERLDDIEEALAKLEAGELEDEATEGDEAAEE